MTRTIAGTAVALIALLAPGVAQAGHSPITTTADSENRGSLRSALQNALPGETISVPAGTYRLELGELEIGTGPLTVQGAGADATVITAQGEDRVLFIGEGAETNLIRLAGMTLRDGSLSDGSGAGIFNVTANLIVADSVVADNDTVVEGGGGGGGIASSGASLTVARSRVVGNSARVSAPPVVTNVPTISGSGGGGILNASAGPLQLIDSTVASNTTTVFATSQPGTGNGGGGILDHGGARLVRSTVRDNGATGSGNTSQSGGGGVNATSRLELLNSTVSGNTAKVTTSSETAIENGGGGLLATGPDLDMTASTLSGNHADLSGGSELGGGGAFFSGRVANVLNSTLSGNRLTLAGSPALSGGGGYHATDADKFTNVTVANNASPGPGGAIFNEGVPSELTRTVLAGNGPGGTQNCAGDFTSLGGNVENANTCGLNGAGDLAGTDPRLGPLASNGGPTLTHALLPGSPAIERGPGGCTAADQRGVARQGVCDSGAYEFDGFSQASASATASQCPSPGRVSVTVTPPPGRATAAVRYRVDGGAEQRAPATSNTVQVALPAGAHTLEYWGEFSDGRQETVHHSQRFDVPRCTLPPPVLGRSFNVVPVKGRVFVSLPRGKSFIAQSVPGLKGRRFIPLEQARQLPMGSLVDTRRGTARITSARPRRGVQAAEFSAGVFQVLQSRKAKAKGLTELRLKGSSFKRCKTAKGKRSQAQSALSRRRIRRLRGSGRGRFRTRGRHSSATVRGTVWTVTDRCDGTLTQVKRGKVAVRDFRRKKTIVLKRGKSYLAKARR